AIWVQNLTSRLAVTHAHKGAVIKAMPTPSHIVSLCLLALSSCFMVAAWYAHLKFKSLPLWMVIVGSWLIALFEYCFQVPGNRIGHSVMSAAQLRIVAEAFTMIAFIGFS